MAVTPTFDALFDRCVGIALDRQAHLLERIGEHDWELDLSAGRMTFHAPGGGNSVTTDVQVLGTESEGEWLWAWANEDAGLPAGVVRASRALGQRADLDAPELTRPRVAVQDDEAHRIAMVASASLDCAGYYRAPYEGGAAYLLIVGPELVEASPPPPVVRLATGWSRVLSAFAARVEDHRAALIAYGRRLGLDVVATPSGLVFEGPSGTVQATLDELGRVSAFQSRGQPR